MDMNIMTQQLKKGKILKVKHGYNPNSSSMGSLIYALPVSMMAVTGGFAVVSALILTAFSMKLRGKIEDSGQDAGNTNSGTKGKRSDDAL